MSWIATQAIMASMAYKNHMTTGHGRFQ
jgi:hypothetical protein